MGAWLRKILERRPARLVTVALANKMARIAWAVMTREEVYRPKGHDRGLGCGMRSTGGMEDTGLWLGCSGRQRGGKTAVQAKPIEVMCLEHASQIGA